MADKKHKWMKAMEDAPSKPAADKPAVEPAKADVKADAPFQRTKSAAQRYTPKRAVKG